MKQWAIVLSFLALLGSEASRAREATVAGVVCAPSSSGSIPNAWYGAFPGSDSVALDFADPRIKDQIVSLIHAYCVPLELNVTVTDRSHFVVNGIASRTPAFPGGVYIVSKIARNKYDEALIKASDLFKDRVEADALARVHFVNVSDGTSGLVAFVQTTVVEKELRDTLNRIQSAVNDGSEAFVVQKFGWSTNKASGLARTFHLVR